VRSISELDRKKYLADGVYVGSDGFLMWLWTNEGDKIAIDETTFKILESYVRLHKPFEPEGGSTKRDPEQYLKECILYSDDVLEWAERIADAKRDLTIYDKEMRKLGFHVENP